MKKLKDIVHVFLTENKRIFTDSGVFLIFIGATILYPLIYGWVYSNEVVKDVPVAVVDNDGSSLSRKMVHMIDETPEVFVKSKCLDLRSAKDSLERGVVNGIITIDRHFTKDVYSGKQGHVSVYADASYFMYYKQVYTGVNIAAGTLGAGIRILHKLAGGAMTNQAFDQAIGVNFISMPLYNPMGGYGSYAMPAILVLILQQLLLIGIGMLGGTDREKGLKHFLFSTDRDIGVLATILGKFTSFFILFSCMAFYLFVVNFKLFHYPSHAEYGTLYIFFIPLIASSIFLGMFLSSFFKSRENSMMFLLFTSMPFVFLSGFSWPMEAMPNLLYYLGRILPSSYGVIGMFRLNVMGGTFDDVRFEWFIMCLLTGLFFILTLLRFYYLSKKLDQK